MRKAPFPALVLLLVLPALAPVAAHAQGTGAQDAPALVYVADAYDPARDPAEDLAAAVALAQASGKRILLEIGGEWCSWCHALDRYLRDNETVAGALGRSFVVVKVNYSEENRNEAFLSAYPKIQGYPHLFVLDTDGAFLHSQGTGELEEDRSYRDEAFMAFAAAWGPEK